MDDPDRSVWFVGDLGDPWVDAIADALPLGSLRFCAPGDLPDGLLEAPQPSETLVLHRSILTRSDAERLRRLRLRRTTRVILCFGAHVRHVDLERWGEFIDVAISEATASETIARRLMSDALRTLSPLRPRPRIAVVSTNTALRDAIDDACELAGYPAAPARHWSDAPPGGPSVWDVPLLQPDWPEEITRRSRVGPVLALLGFADRGLVRLARDAGAAACLELPFDVADLASALDRMTTPRGRPAHEVPPPPVSWRRQAVGEPGWKV